MKIALDFETRGLRLEEGQSVDDFILGYAVASSELNEAYEWNPAEELAGLKKLCKEHTLIFHNATFELYVLETLLGLEVLNYEDTAQMGYVWYPGVPEINGSRHSLAAWAERAGYEKYDSGVTDWSMATWDEAMQTYCKQDAFITLKVYEYLFALLSQDQIGYKFYQEIALPFARSAIQMEHNGLHYDRERLQEFILARIQRCGELSKEMETIVPKAPGRKFKYATEHPDDEGLIFVGTEEKADTRKSAEEGATRTYWVYKKWEDFNPNSNAQIGWALKHYYGWEPTEFGKDGSPSTGAEILEPLEYPLAKLLCEYSKEIKLVSSFGESILESMDKHNRIYPSVNTTGTLTGRLSMSKPNLQTVPTRGEHGSEYRKCVTAAEGNKLVGCDMGGFQIKILAYFLAVLVGNTALLDKMNEGIDAHTATGQIINEARQVGKTINFSVAFGAGAKKLADGLGCSIETANGYLDKVDEFLSVTKLKHALWAICEAQGGVIHDLLGRRLVYEDIAIDNREYKSRAERQSFNALIQSTEASVMFHVCERVRIALIGKPAKIILAVHDELLVECKESVAQEVADIMTEIFSDIRYLPLLTVVDNQAKIGDNWFEIH